MKILTLEYISNCIYNVVYKLNEAILFLILDIYIYQLIESMRFYCIFQNSFLYRVNLRHPKDFISTIFAFCEYFLTSFYEISFYITHK